jgi:acyl dehydratase
MTAPRDFSRLPEQVSLESTVTSQDERPVQAPEGDRNPALWDALEAGG